MELLQLKYFCDAAVTENFSKTAAKFLVPPSNISQTIKRLEKELGTELFEHKSNKITLSAAGKRFYENASAALALLDEAKETASAENKIHGEIKLVILANRRIVTKAIEDFTSAYPDIHFVIRHERDGMGDCDILISDKCPIGYIEEGPIVEEDILLAMSKEHPLASRKALSVSDLKNESFISMPSGRSIYGITEDICRQAGFIPNITIQTDDPYYVRKYVELGLGVAFFPACSWQGLFSEKAILKKAGSYRRITSVYLPNRKKIKASVSEFIRFLHSAKSDEKESESVL